MELLKLVRRRSFLSELVYTVLNIGLAVAIVLTVFYTQSVWLGLLVVLISKWRIFAVRIRYWYANFLSNVVDLIVSVGFVLHIFTLTQAGLDGGTEFWLLALSTLLYIGWLLFLKPRSKRAFVVAQAAVATFVGTATLYTVSFDWPVSLVVLAMWVIGYSAARHVLSTYDNETHSLALSLFWGVVMAQIGWVAYHWTIAYALPFTPNVLLPQIAIIATLVSFVAFKAYDSLYHHDKVRTQDILLPLLFTLSVIIVLLTLFNRVGSAI